MHSESDTEYETDSASDIESLSEPKQEPSELESAASDEPLPSPNATILDTLRQHGPDKKITQDELRSAVQMLERASREESVDDDAETHIFDSAAIVVHVLEHGWDGWSFWDVRQTGLNAEFVDALFKLRARYRPPGHSDHIATFADAILALLFPTSAPRQSDSSAGSLAWESMRQRDILFAVTCLPDKLHELPECIRDNFTSAATRRLALTLLWGCHVLWAGWKPPEDLDAALEVYIDKVCREDAFTSRECLAYTYALALFATVADPCAFRPSTHSMLFSALSFMFEQPSSQDDEHAEKLDAVDTLVRYGRFVKWAWQAWPCTEQNQDVLCGLTALWLRQQYEKLGRDGDWRAAFGDNAGAALPVLRTMLKRAGPSATALLTPLLTALVHSHAHMQDAVLKEDVFLTVSSLMLLECQSEVKELIVRLWSNEVATNMLSLLEGNAIMDIVNGAASCIADCIDDLPEDAEPAAVLKTKPLLEFLCIAAQSSILSIVLSQHASFVPKLSQWACGFERASAQVENYRAAVVLLFGLITGFSSKKKELSYDAEAIHDVMLATGPTSVLSAGAYAQYIRKLVTRKKATQLMRLEAWDYFVDALHVSPDDPDVFAYRDLLEVSFSLYCAALNAALRNLDPGPRQFVLASERTISMAKQLQVPMNTETDEGGLISVNKTASRFLLSKLKAALTGASLDEPFPIKFRLAYAEFKGSMRVITVPVPPDS